MAKFSGKIGYASEYETAPGVWTPDIITKTHRGDILRNQRRWQAGDEVNSDLTISNRISIVADSFSLNNTHNMRYVEFNGGKWAIRSVEISRPRIIIELGSLYKEGSNE